jgi:ankyrin repeat protein
MVKLLLDADKSSAYQFDNKGSLPIHVAAMENVGEVVRVFLNKCPSCAEVRDAECRTFLHIAILERNSDVVSTVFSFFRGRQQLERFEMIVNMRDRDGNTGLHLAVQKDEIFYCLLWNKGVLLNLRNSMGRTAMDLAKKPTSLRSLLVSTRGGAHAINLVLHPPLFTKIIIQINVVKKLFF